MLTGRHRMAIEMQLAGSRTTAEFQTRQVSLGFREGLSCASRKFWTTFGAPLSA